MESICVTQYKAFDGTVFTNQKDCLDYEVEFDKVKAILQRIPSVKVQGQNYVQFDKNFLLQIKRDLFNIVLEYYGDSYPKWRKFNPDEVHPLSVVGRILDDCGGPINNAWSKLSFFNFELGRKYEQPYYALHPEEARTSYQV
jgi:hypothetical protein